MRQIVVGLMLLLALTACETGEWGPMLTEPGKVEAKTFMPSGHGSGVGMSTRGSLVVSSVDIPARYGVSFRCQHGSFAIAGESGSKAERAWKVLEQGEAVTIYYQEYVETIKGSRDDPGAKIVTALRFDHADKSTP